MTTSKLTPTDVIQLARENNVEMVDLKFTDVPGTLQQRASPYALGDYVFRSFIENKKIEWERYRLQVTDYELERYLQNL